MRSYDVLIIIFVGLFLLADCTSVRLTTFRDPAFQTVKFTRIAVVGDFADLDHRQRVEAKVVEALRARRVDAIEGVSILPPTRTFTAEERQHILSERGIEGFLLIGLEEAGFISAGTEDLEKQFASLKVRLIAVANDRVAWMADSRVQNLFATTFPDSDFAKLLNAFSKKLAEKLIMDGVTAPTLGKVQSSTP